MMKVRERVLVLSLCLIVVVAVPGFLYRLAMDQDSWRPNDIYNSVGGSYYSSASVGSSSSDGVAVSVRGGVRSSRRVAAPVFSYARNAEGLSAIAVANSQSPIANSQGLYTTSSHMAKSFGSGLAVGNVATSHVTRNAEQSSASSLSVPSFVSYSASEDDVYAFASQSVSSVSVSVSEMTAVGASAAPTIRSASARRRAPGTTGGAWDYWLSGLGTESGFLYVDDDGNRYYDMEALRAYFENNKDNFPGWTWDRFLAEYFNAKGQDKHRVPLGEAWVLLAMALVYVLARLFKSRRLAVNN